MFCKCVRLTTSLAKHNMELQGCGGQTRRVSVRGYLQGEDDDDGEGDVMMSVGSLLLCSSVTVLECYSVTVLEC